MAKPKLSDVKNGNYYIVNPFRKHQHAGARIQIMNCFGVDFLARIVFNNKEIFVYYSDLFEDSQA